MLTQTLRATALGGVLIASSILAASGQPAGAAKPAEAAMPDDAKCVTSKEGFWQDGKRAMFKVDLRNECAKRMRCVVNVYVITAAGPAKGQATLMLAANRAGASGKTARTSARAQRSYTLPLKMSVGSANVSRNCRAV
jgi:hypothetical protein